MKKHIILSLSILALLLSGCTKEEITYTDQKETLVIDGWIESGNNPMVFVTTAIPASNKQQSIAELANHLIRYAKVTIEHDGVEYPLTACLSDYYYIQTYFTTTDLIGEVGEEYTLTVEYKDMYATSTTTIPEPAYLDSIWTYEGLIEPYKALKCSFTDDHAEERYYRFFTWITNRQNHYCPSYLGLMDNSAAGEKISIEVDPGFELPNISEYPKYYSGDIVSIKFCTMTADTYLFWSKVDQNNLLAFLPINVAGGNLNGNVEGALGCWAGYGITEYSICVK